MPLKFVLLGLCLLSSASAQQPSIAPVPTNPSAKPPVATPSDRYASEAAVMEHLATVYRYAADGTGSKQLTLSVRVQTEAAVRQLGVITIPFASAEEHVEFDYVRVRRSDGTVVETPATEAQEISSEVTRQAPLYSDLKEKQLPVRSLRVGDTLEYQARVVRTVAEAPGEIWGTHSQVTGLVVLDETVELRLPAAKTINVWSPTSKPVIKEENGERIYRWTGSQLETTAGPEADAKKEADKTRTLTPAEAADLQFGKFPFIAWTSFKSWDAVGTWYRSLEADRTVADSDIKAKVAELTAGKTTNEEKIRAIYSYVATNIRYIGVDLGVGRYQPHLASEVLRNQYGDCKDKHTLLAAMLIQAGFDPSAVLVGVNIRFNPDVPSPANFNHVITQVAMPGSADGKPIWLDSTEEVAPYRAMFSVVRDKDVLVAPQTGLARIEKTPATLPYPSVEQFDSVGTLTAEGISDSHIVFTLRGDDELVFRSVIHQLSPGQYGDFIQRVFQNFGYAGTTSHPEISRPESTSDPLRIACDYKREKPGDWDNFRIYPQFPPANLGAPDDKDPPKIPIELGLPRVEAATSALKLPEGWGATLPSDVHVKTPFATFDKTYRLEKGTLYADRKLEILKTEIPAADWKLFKRFTDDIALNNEPTIQLTSTGKRTSVPAPPAPSIFNDEANRLLQQADNDSRARRFDESLADLDQAKKLNDQQPFLWSTYGFRSQMQGKFAEAVDFYKKELSLHPDESYVYSIMSDAELTLDKRKEAEQTLRDRLANAGPDENTSIQLAGLLSADEDYPAAVSVLDAAKIESSNKPGVQLLVGRTYLKGGKVSRGKEILRSLADTTKEPGILNDCAYALADADTQLDVAEHAARKALDELGKKTATLSADGQENEASANTRQIVATWDTLGWVLFHEHKVPEAEAYIRASWLVGQHGEVGLHLGQIEEAQGKTSAALATYSMAANPPGLPSSHKELYAHIAALQQKKIAGKYRAEPTPFKLMQNLRTVQLGSANGTEGTHELTLVLSSSGIVAASKSTDKPALKNEDEILKHLDIESWWPDHSNVRILRKGILNCFSGKCEFVYIPL